MGDEAEKRELWWRKLALALRGQRQREEWTDVELVCGDGGRMTAHSAVLAAVCPLIKSVLKDDGVKIVLPHFPSSTVSAFLQAIYLGQVGADVQQDVLEMCKLLGMSQRGQHDGVQEEYPRQGPILVISQDSKPTEEDQNDGVDENDPCQLCQRSWTSHAVAVRGSNRPVYRCCLKSCADEGTLMSCATALRRHLRRHDPRTAAPMTDASRPCPICSKAR